MSRCDSSTKHAPSHTLSNTAVQFIKPVSVRFTVVWSQRPKACSVWTFVCRRETECVLPTIGSFWRLSLPSHTYIHTYISTYTYTPTHTRTHTHLRHMQQPWLITIDTVCWSCICFSQVYNFIPKSTGSLQNIYWSQTFHCYVAMNSLLLALYEFAHSTFSYIQPIYYFHC
jgi:hypothetical protein